MLSATTIQGEEIGLDASWQFSSMDTSDSEAIDAFNQRYGLRWNPRVTRAISLNANVNYSKNVTTGNIIHQTYSPTASLQVDNDLFMAELSGLISETSNSQRRDQLDRSWEAVLASNWSYEFWPSLSVTGGQQWLGDNEPIPMTDVSQQWAEFIAQWELDSFESYYSYYNNLRDDSVAGTIYDEQKHFGRMEYGNSFFDNLLNVNFSGQLTNTTTNIIASGGQGDIVSIRIPMSQALAGVDPVPVSGGLPGIPALIDGNKNSIAFSINFNEVANIGVKADVQAVDTLYVYTGPIAPLLVNETSSLRWNLYSSANGVNWQIEQSNPATSYDQDNFRYQVNIGTIERVYLKLVVTAWPTSLTIPITEIEAYSSQGVSGAAGSNFTTNQVNTRVMADMNLHYTPTTNTSLNYSLTYDNSESNTGNNRRRIFQSWGGYWFYNQYFSPSLTINDTSTSNSAISDTSQRSYALNIESIFLPTLDTSIGISRNENLTDNTPLTTNHSVHLNLTAALYPNLDTTLELSSSLNKDVKRDKSSETLSLRWTLTARPRPTVLVDFIAEYGAPGLGFTEIIDLEQSGGRATLNVNWRPSDLISIRANASEGYGELWSGYESFQLDSNFSIIRTSKSIVTIGHKVNSTKDSTTQGLNANWSWNLSEFFTMQSIANYIISQDENSWLINARLTTRF